MTKHHISANQHVTHEFPEYSLVTWKDQRDHKWFLLSEKWRFVMMVQGENILISDCYWNSHFYCLHDSDFGLYKMKICRHSLWKPKKPHWDAHIKGKQTSFVKSYRKNLTTHIRAYVNSVQYAHLMGVKNWKYLTAWCKFTLTAKVWAVYVKV